MRSSAPRTGHSESFLRENAPRNLASQPAVEAIRAEGDAAPRDKQLRILSLCCAYPNPDAPGTGGFVRSRLEHMSRQAEIRVIAPMPLFRYAKLGRKGFIGTAPDGWQQDLTLRVAYPRWFYLPGGGFLNGFFLALQIIRTVARLRGTFPFDVIDAHFAHPEGIAAAVLGGFLGIPFSVTLRGCELEHGRYPLRRICMSWALRRACRVISVSEQLRNYSISLGADPQRATCIPNGVDASVFYPRDRAACRSKHAISQNRRVILAAGHLIPLKGHQHIIRALKRLVDSGIDAELLIAGDTGQAAGGYEQTLRTLPVELGIETRVRFLGRVAPPVLAELMSAADVFCLASSREGWPNVVHEALGCGTPAVATAVGGAPDLIPSKQFGLLVEAPDPDTLANALHSALQTRWDHEKICAWAHTKSWHQVADEVIEQLRISLTLSSRSHSARD